MIPIIPRGKFLFIWQIKNVAGGVISDIVDKALDLGLSGVSIKSTQCDAKYNLRWAGDRWVDDILPPLVYALHAAGLRVNGWGWVDGDRPIAEAVAAVDRIRQLNLDGWDVDAEGSYKNKPVSAEIYMEELRDQLGLSYPIGLTSYRYPTLHPEFPWQAFCQSIDYHLPQVYWNPPYPPNYGPVPELERSVRELRAVRDIPIFPAGRAYIGDGHADPKPAELTAFMQRAKELGLPGFSFWAMDFLYLHAGGDARAQAIADFEFGTPPPPPPPPPPAPGAKCLVVADVVNVRTGPGTIYPVVAQLHKNDTGIVTETAGTDVWYRIGAEKWIASYVGGKRYAVLTA